jgi:RNA polymerase sigma-70 factor (ECF subfamily)
LAAWAEFHQQIGSLPDEEREVFDLLWYQGLSQTEAAGVLHVSERTIKRRWQAARYALSEAMEGELPGE